MNTEISTLTRKVFDTLHSHALHLVTVESCTGGWVAKSITDIAGSSAVFDRGYVVYNAAAKQEMLGVSVETLASHGEVSEATVIELVQGALQRCQADVAVAISGIAGPGGGSDAKPVGMVCFAWALRGVAICSDTHYFAGDRAAVRLHAVVHALQGILRLLDEHGS